jgi:hypothetical protein
MKTFKNALLAIALTALVISCQSGTDVKQILSNAETRKAIMDSISNNSEMSREMMTAMVNNKKCSMMMMEDHGNMTKMMKENPGMMKGMMSDMMACCKTDTAMMSTVCKSMMASHEMMECMHKMNTGSKDTKEMNHKKSHH